jgi:hypothetical protein
MIRLQPWASASGRHTGAEPNPENPPHGVLKGSDYARSTLRHSDTAAFAMMSPRRTVDLNRHRQV